MNISFELESGDKLGIIGRTGSGKSSLMMAFFRMVPFSGRVRLDGVDARRVALGDLRARVGAVPQAPLLFRAPLRRNLDPAGLHSDQDIWDALDKCHIGDLFRSRSETDSGRIQSGLSLMLGNGPECVKLSFGQKQLLCLARTLLKRPKIVFIDEATASIDSQTDALIQNTLKDNFANCTLLMIAHRMSTVSAICTKVLALENGELRWMLSIEEAQKRNFEISLASSEP
uniref:ABC transporter domain-containing protein n=1 Tax=Heterosigma akashiwo TaxID=2829 RepID=A0A6V1N447_HETAK